MNRLRLIPLVLAVALVLVPTTALATAKRSVVYTAVGDSIAVGTGATDASHGYVGLFASHLAQGHRTTTLNRACYNGMTSGLLLGHLTIPAAPHYADFNAAVAGADIITVSIGGNDLLQTVAGITPAYLLNLSDGDRALLLGALSAQLNTHIAEFTANWPAIVTRMRYLNPTAKVFVNTVYNPFKAGDGLYELVDPYIRGINGVIVAGAATGDYKIVDVYAKFSDYGNPRKLLVWGLDGAVPLHPTDRGYKLIYNLLKDAYGA